MAARRAANQELTRDMIMDAARDLFVHQGYQHTSMRMVAAELGYSHGAIYYHFKNKAELFYALVRQDFLLLNEKLETMIREEGLDNERKLENILLGFIEFGLVNQSHYEIMFLIKDQELATHLTAEPFQSYEMFASAVFALTGKKATIPVIWSIFLALHGFVSHYLKTGQTFEDVKPMAKVHVEFILKGVR